MYKNFYKGYRMPEDEEKEGDHDIVQPPPTGQ